MTPGPSEELGKAAHTFMDAMRQEPLSLALVVMNVLLIAYLFFNEQKYIEGRRDLANQLFTHAKNTSDLLAKCIAVDDMNKLIEQMRRPTPP